MLYFVALGQNSDFAKIFQSIIKAPLNHIVRQSFDPRRTLIIKLKYNTSRLLL